jgi:D-xylose transport system substrate-binding protein
MKKIAAIVVVGSIVLIAIAIFLSKTFFKQPSLKETNSASNLRIGFSLGDLREERWQKDRDLFVAAAEKLGAYVQVTSANSDADLQKNQIENLISQGVNVLVIMPYDAEKVASTIELAHKAKIKVLSYDRLIRDSDLDYYVTFDNAKVGQMEAQAVMAVKNTGNVAYIGGAPSDNNSKFLKQGAMSVLSPLIKDGSIKLVVDQFTPDWKPEEAYKTIKQYLSTGGKLDAVVAANDGTAFGSIRALKEYKLDGKVPVSGQDAELSACQRVIEGTQTVTVYKPIPALAQKAAEIAVALAKGEISPANNKTNNGKIDVPSFYLDPIMVTKENMDATVIKDGFHTKEQVYQTSK